MRRGQRNESGRGAEGVSAMTAAAMSSRGRWAADDATSQTAGWQTMQQEGAVITTTIDQIWRRISRQKQAADDGRQMTGGGWRITTAGDT